MDTWIIWSYSYFFWFTSNKSYSNGMDYKTVIYFGLKNIGAIAPGFRADFILLDHLESFRISEVFLDGKRIDMKSSNNRECKIKNTTYNIRVNNTSLSSSSLCILQNTMRIKILNDPNIFIIPAKARIPSSSSLLLVIGVIPGQIITQKRIIEPKLDNDYSRQDQTQTEI